MNAKLFDAPKLCNYHFSDDRHSKHQHQGPNEMRLLAEKKLDKKFTSFKIESYNRNNKIKRHPRPPQEATLAAQLARIGVDAFSSTPSQLPLTYFRFGWHIFF